MQITGLDQITGSAVAVFVLNYLKNSKWFTLLSSETPKLNRLAAVVTSGLLSIGIHITYSQSTGTAVITGLALSSIAYGLWHWLNSFATQEIIYQATKKPAPAAAVVVAAPPQVGMGTGTAGKP